MGRVDPDHPPDWLGTPMLVSRGEMEEAMAWRVLDGLAPHSKRRAILDAVEKVRRALFGDGEA
jgi:hypothetical protein